MLTEFVVLAVACLRNSISNQKQPVTGFETDFRFFIVHVGKHAEYDAALGQSCDRAVSTDEDRRYMTGIAVTKRMTAGVENSIEERREPVGWCVFQSNTVESSAHFCRTGRTVREAAHTSLHIGH